MATATPTFQWDGIAAASGYILDVEDTDTNTTVVSGLNVTGTSYTLSAPLPNGNYQWSLQAFDSAGDVSLPSQPLAFAVDVTLGTPTQQQLSGNLSAATPKLQWSPVSGAAGYYLTVTDTTTNPNSPFIDNLPIPGTSYTITAPLKFGDDYQWSVTAYDNSGNLSPDVQPKPFILVAPPTGPAAPTAISPTFGSVIVPTQTPTLSWSPVSGAAYYEVEVFDDTGTNSGHLAGNPPVIGPVQVNSGTSDAVGVSLTDGESYQWQVSAVDGTGLQGLWSAPAPFTPEANLSLSTISVASASIISGGSTTVTLTADDNTGKQEISGGLNVSFAKCRRQLRPGHRQWQWDLHRLLHRHDRRQRHHYRHDRRRSADQQQLRP